VTKIAISYRRADTEVMAGRIRDRLADRYGGDTVFMDIDDIPYGKDFRTHIFETIVQSDVLLVIVGQRWLGAGRGGTRRIDNETDFAVSRLRRRSATPFRSSPSSWDRPGCRNLRSFPKV